MGRRKCLIIPVLMAGILLMGGCSRQSIEDVKRFQETSTAVENQTNQTGIIQENESRENKVDNVFEEWFQVVLNMLKDIQMLIWRFIQGNWLPNLHTV